MIFAAKIMIRSRGEGGTVNWVFCRIGGALGRRFVASESVDCGAGCFAIRGKP
jgi:hypothetical protein